MSPSRALVFSTLTIAIALASGRARAEDRQACVAAYEEGQSLRKEGKLTRARERLLVCAQEGCSPVLRKDCTVWIGELERETPTVVLAVRGPHDEDIVDARVVLDGKELTHRLDGKALAIDPGPHTFQFEIKGAAPRNETVLVREGELNRRIVADFRVRSESDPVAHSAAHGVEQPVTRPAPTPAGVYALGALGVAGIGVFTTFGLLGMSQKDDLDAKQCKPNCAQSDVDAVKRKFLIADVGLGVGLASLTFATILYFTKGEEPSPRPAALSLDVAPTRDGASLHLRGAF